MARRRTKVKDDSDVAPSSTSASIVEIPEAEQQRLIDESGILKKITSKIAVEDTSASDEDDPFSPLCNEIFNSILLIIPLSALYMMMVMYVSFLAYRLP